MGDLLKQALLTELKAALERDWQPVSRPALAGWLVSYSLFLVYALTHRDEFLFIDNANLVVHEAGHLLFGWFGETLGLWGGTLLQLLVPLALCVWFVFQRQAQGAAFAALFFFENFLYIATYMADARMQELPLVTVGGDEAGHDWFEILSSLGLLQYDTALAQLVRALGWAGMLGTVGWLVWRWRAQ